MALDCTPPDADAGAANFEMVATERGGGNDDDDDDDDDDASRVGGNGAGVDIYNATINTTISLYFIIHYNRSTLHNNASPGAKNHLRPFMRVALNARNKNS